MTTSGIVKAHDLAVTSVTPSSKVPRVGEQVNLTASITNIGDYTDSSNLNYYANSTLVNSQPVTLTPGQTSTITLPWDSTGRPTGLEALTHRLEGRIPGDRVVHYAVRAHVPGQDPAEVTKLARLERFVFRSATQSTTVVPIQ